VGTKTAVQGLGGLDEDEIVTPMVDEVERRRRRYESWQE